MTKKTKLEIIGEYRKDHPGPFCTRDGRPVRIICDDMKNEKPLIGIITNDDGSEYGLCAKSDGSSSDWEDRQSDFMCAREVLVPREFWINQYSWGIGLTFYTSASKAAEFAEEECIGQCLFREVLLGEGV